jgi:hypothetical protein
MVSARVWMFHPNNVNCSDSLPSSSSFPRDRQSSRKIGSDLSNGLQRVCMDNSKA